VSPPEEPWSIERATSASRERDTGSVLRVQSEGLEIETKAPRGGRGGAIRRTVARTASHFPVVEKIGSGV
jgi:hypothetical protein